MSAVCYSPPVNPFEPKTHLREWALFQSCLRAGLFLNVEGWRENVLSDAQREFFEKHHALNPDKPQECPTIETFGAYLRAGHGQFRTEMARLGWIVEPPGQDRVNRPTADGKEHDGRLWAVRLAEAKP